MIRESGGLYVKLKMPQLKLSNLGDIKNHCNFSNDTESLESLKRRLHLVKYMS